MREQKRRVIDGAELRKIRYARGYSINDVVKKLNEEHLVKLHPDSLRCIELGYRNPSPRVFAALAKVLDADPFSLYQADK